ncbi:MAG: hypothetical protein WC728_01315 [Elusimicrobiota bacterium]
MRPFVARRRFYACSDLRRIAALNRIQALACIKAAEHGWLGASYSAAELLTVLYFGLGERNVVLSKGHAAPMQYACLYGLGVLTEKQLLSYKDGPDGLQAHTDIGTPGILVNTGSLGQALSKTAGLAWSHPKRRYYVVLGDGELQEGQNFEAFQTVNHLRLKNLTVIVDRNRYQTALPVESVKGIPDLRRVSEGFGFSVLETDGHDLKALLSALRKKTARPKLIISNTLKGAGSRYLGGKPWHSAVPDDALYLRIVQELAAQAGLTEEFAEYRASSVPGAPRPKKPSGSTRDWFADELAKLMKADPRIVALGADLAESCGMGRLPKYLEMGISEQDMVSFAGGLALAGKIPVVNTYASFYKRAYEQVFTNQSEGRKVLYAGHYAGLCYHTDGKSHQSLNDLSLMRTVPGLIVVEPVDEAQTRGYLRWALRKAPGSVYFRLRRTPAGISLGQEVRLDRPAVVGAVGRRAYLTSGTVATGLVLKQGSGVIVQSVFNHELDLVYYRRLLRPVRELIMVEDNVEPGGLSEFACRLLLRLGLHPKVGSLSAEGFGPSFRTLSECLEHFGFIRTRIYPRTCSIIPIGRAG